MLLTQHVQDPEDFEKAHFGYSSEYAGVGVYLFQHPVEKKWKLMMIQNTGLRNPFPNPTQMHSAYNSKNGCDMKIEEGKRASFRLEIDHQYITIHKKEAGRFSFMRCQTQPKINLFHDTKQLYLGLATKNSIDDSSYSSPTPKQTINDINLHGISFFVTGKDSKNLIQADMLAEKTQLIAERSMSEAER